MKFLVGLIIIVGLSLGAYQLYEYWGKFKEPEAVTATPAAPQISGQELPGLVPRLEPILETAQRRGAPGLHDFLNTYGNTVSDPRRAWIELDYVVLVAQNNPAEARRVFAKVKSRVSANSPVYPRVQQLEKTYE
jgi:hypothetical protein